MMRTRCPSCQTVFRLGDEQLRARQGIVRCGHCFQPFNAIDHEVDRASAPLPAAPPLRPPASAASPTVAASPARADARPPAALDFGLLDEFTSAEEPPISLPPQAAAASVAPRPEVIRSGRRSSAAAAETELPLKRLSATSPAQHYEELAHARLTEAEPEDDALEEDESADVRFGSGARPGAGSAEFPPHDSPQHTAAASGSEDRSASAAAHPPPEESRDEIAAAHVRFEPRSLDARYGPRKAPPSPLLRMFGGMGAGLLAGLLAVQLVYLYRMEIARDLPGLRPLLLQACAEIGCTVPLPHDIALIAVEASELQSEPGQPGSYQLNLTVSNQAGYLQAWPHLELTLTDGGDSPIARRVLTPEQWAGTAAFAEALAGHQVVAARIPFRTATPTPTGYRVNVFYP